MAFHNAARYYSFELSDSNFIKLGDDSVSEQVVGNADAITCREWRKMSQMRYAYGLRYRDYAAYGFFKIAEDFSKDLQKSSKRENERVCIGHLPTVNAQAAQCATPDESVRNYGGSKRQSHAQIR